MGVRALSLRGYRWDQSISHQNSFRPCRASEIQDSSRKEEVSYLKHISDLFLQFFIAWDSYQRRSRNQWLIMVFGSGCSVYFPVSPFRVGLLAGWSQVVHAYRQAFAGKLHISPEHLPVALCDLRMDIAKSSRGLVSLCPNSEVGQEKNPGPIVLLVVLLCCTA